MTIPDSIIKKLRGAIRTDRLRDTALRLVEVPSPTRSAGAVADRLAEMLVADGFSVRRPAAGWPQAPAVVARFAAPRPGRTLQFDGHLDTVHLPFVPPHVANGVLYGSGAADMKGGIAAAYEAMRALRDTGVLGAGSVLFTAHELHECPWGDGSQVDRLIDQGVLGDAVLLPEYVSDRLPIIGRGLAVIEVRVSRDGVPVHEVLGGIDQPNVIAAGAQLVSRFAERDRELARAVHPTAGRGSIFVGRAWAGEIYNQSPTEFRLAGTRRWLPGTRVAEVEHEYFSILATVASQTGTRIDGTFTLARDAFQLDDRDPAVDAFHSAYEAVTGRRLPDGDKPFVDDGNTFASRGRVAAISHGPDASGAHTVNESVSVDELTRVALVYALSAVAFC
ncbi:MAG: M20 family metallopeptidase [Armatimonadota bacterium]